MSFASPLKQTRQRASELAVEIADVKRQRAAVAEGPLKASRPMTDAERTQFLRLGQHLTILEGHAAENAVAQQAAEEQNEGDRTFGTTAADPDGGASLAARRRANLPVHGETPGAVRPSAGPRFAQMFGAATATLDGWDSRAEYLHVLTRGLHDPRLRAEAHSGDTPSMGGYAIPTALWAEILDTALEGEVVRPRASIFPMTTRELDVPCWDDADRSGGAIANMALRFEGEGDTAEPQVSKLRALKLRARKGMIFAEAPNELLADAATFDRNLTLLLARALGFGFDHRFLFGAGAGSPLGALVAPCTISVSRSVANQILYEDLVAMFSRLAPGSVSNSAWLANPSTIPQLAALSVVVGTGGSHVPAMSQNDGKFYVLTREVVFTEKVPALGSASDISLCDFTQYAIGLRKDSTLDKSQHVGFARDVETYRMQARIDGQPMLNAPITPLNGSTMSPFVTLAA